MKADRILAITVLGFSSLVLGACSSSESDTPDSIRDGGHVSGDVGQADGSGALVDADSAQDVVSGPQDIAEVHDSVSPGDIVDTSDAGLSDAGASDAGASDAGLGDAGAGDSDSPDADLAKSICGNGVVEAGEDCDDGKANSDTEPNACRSNCSHPSCGDGVVDDAKPWSEQCDLGKKNGELTSICDEKCAKLVLCPGVQRIIQISCPAFLSVEVDDDTAKPLFPLYPAGKNLTADFYFSQDCDDSTDDYVVEVHVKGCGSAGICAEFILDSTIGSASSDMTLWLFKHSSASSADCYKGFQGDVDDLPSFVTCDANALDTDNKSIKSTLTNGIYHVLINGDAISDTGPFNLKLTMSSGCS